MAAWAKYRGRELVIVCRHCGQVKACRSLDEQRRRKTCSRRCAALSRPGIDPAAAARGRALAGRRKRQAALEALTGLTVLQAFQRGYMNGLRSKLTQIRKRYDLVPKRTSLAPLATTTACGLDLWKRMGG